MRLYYFEMDLIGFKLISLLEAFTICNQCIKPSPKAWGRAVVYEFLEDTFPFSLFKVTDVTSNFSLVTSP